MTGFSSGCWSRPTCGGPSASARSWRRCARRPSPELPDYREVMVSVRKDSTVRRQKTVYSVPESRLIGVKLLAAHRRKPDRFAGGNAGGGATDFGQEGPWRGDRFSSFDPSA